MYNFIEIYIFQILRPFDLVLKSNGFEKQKNTPKNVKITKNIPNTVKNHLVVSSNNDRNRTQSPFEKH